MCLPHLGSTWTPAAPVQANVSTMLVVTEMQADLRKAGPEHVGTRGGVGALTCAHVDSQGYDHGSCHNPAPSLHLGLPHAVEDGHTAHVALSG